MSDTVTADSLLGSLFVCGFVFAILASQGVLWFFILRWIKRRGAEGTAVLTDALAQLAASGEQTVLPPSVCRLRVGHVTRTHVRVALTTGRVLWYTGARHEIALRDLRDVRDASKYNGGSAREVGFGFTGGGHVRWVEEVKRLLGRA